MKFYQALGLVLPLLFLSGCFWGDEFETKHLTGQYYLNEVAPDSGAWYLHFDDEKFGLADALFNCQVVEAGFNEKCIIMRAVCTTPQFYIARINGTADREVARRNIIGPLTKREFNKALHQYMWKRSSTL